MTDDRLEKVRKWLKGTLSCLYEEAQCEEPLSPETEGMMLAYREVRSFINSLQEEPKFKIGQTITDPDDSTFTFHINKIEDGKYIESDDAWVLIKDADEEYEFVEKPKIPQVFDEGYWERLGEEPVSEELEEACEQLAENARKRKAETSSPFFSQTDYRQGVMDGAKWREQQFENNRLKHCNSITNEQVELEQGFIDQHLDKHQRMPTFLDAIEYGMKLMKEQMMKDAVDGEVEEYYPTTIHLDKDISELKHFDKVKLIIIMEE